MSYVDVLCDTMRDQLESADDTLDDLAVKAPGIAEVLADLACKPFPNTPQFIEDRIATLLLEQIREAIDYSRNCTAAATKLVNSFGSPDALRAAADVLSGSVSVPSDNLSIAMDPAYLLGMREDNWTGGGAEGYSLAFAGQPGAVDVVSDYSEKLHDALRSLADGIEQFYIELGIAVTTLVSAIIALVVAIITAATMVGIPVAVGSAVVAQLSLNTSIMALLAMILTVTQTVGNAIDKINEDVVDWPTPPIQW